MAVLGRLLIGSQQRVDLPDFLSIESYVASDFKHLIKSFIGSTPLVLKGFEVIDASSAIGGTSVSIKIADSVLYHSGSSAGSFYYGLPEGDTLSEPLVPELRLDATNYVYLTLTSVGKAQDSRAFWDVDLNGGQGGEFNQDVNTESVLTVQINVSVSTFPEGSIPLTKIVTNSTSIQEITDCRNMMFRLGTGGINPDPTSTYSFRSLPTSDYKRNEPPTTIFSSAQLSPFFGGDKNIQTLKEWMDVVMTKLLELSGTTYWYESSAAMSIANVFNDTLGSSLKSKGRWIHDLTTPGKISWTEDIVYRKMNDPRDIIIRSNSTGVQLADDQVMYVNFIRDQWVNNTNVTVNFISSVNYVNGSLGGGSFENLNIGDWVKKQSDDDNKYLRVVGFCSSLNGVGIGALPINAVSIVLEDVYSGTNESTFAVYSKGEYLNTDIQIGNRKDAGMFTSGGNFYWLANRSDTVQNISSIAGVIFSSNVNIVESDGIRAKLNFISNHNLNDGDRVTIENAGAYNGEYQVEVSSNTQIIIQTNVTTNAVGATVSWAIVTTSTRDLVSGFQLESANHSFESNQSIVVHSSFSIPYEGQYLINNRSSTTFQISVDSLTAATIFNPSVTPTTAACARVNLKTEFGAAKVIQGESIDINEPDTVNILNFIGMDSLAQSNPVYLLPDSYNTLKGFQNFNCSDSDNLTLRLSKLTAMMGDRVQDRGLKIVNRVNIRNFTSGLNQVVSCSGNLVIEKPRSSSQVVTMPANFSLQANHALTATIHREDGTAITPVIEELGSPFLIEENKIILFYRFSGTSIYSWDGQEIKDTGGWVNEYETSQSKNIIVHDQAGVRYNSTTGAFNYLGVAGNSVSIIIPGSADINTIDIGAINTLTPVIAEGQVAWVRVSRVFAKVIDRISYIVNPVVEDNDVSGILYVTDRDEVPTDQDVISLYIVNDNTFIRVHHKDGIGNVYEEDYIVAFPGTAPITIPLPNDSRDNGAVQYYVVGSGQLEIFLNGQKLRSGEDWAEIGLSGSLAFQVQILQNIVAGDVLTFRIGTTGAVYFAPSPTVSVTLQDAYEGGPNIVTTGTPVHISGPVGDKLLWVEGDVQIDGVLDPTALQLKPQTVNPLEASQHGLWVDSDGNLIQERPTKTPSSLDITTSILDLQDQTAAPSTFITAGKGLKWTTDQKMDVENSTTGGIDFDIDEKIIVKLDPAGAIVSDTDGIQVKLEASNTSLQIDGSNQLGVKVDTAGAVIKGASGVKVQLEATNPSLKIDGSNQLGAKLNAAGAIESTANGLGVRVDNDTIEINGSNQLKVKNASKLYIELTNNTGSTILAGSTVSADTTANQIILANATTYSSSQRTVGVVLSDILDGESGKVQIAGVASVITTGLTIGNPAYLSTVSGSIESNIPSVTGAGIYVVGVAVSTTEIVIKPYVVGVKENIYEEESLLLSPISSGDVITLPVDSRDGGSAQTYTMGTGELEIFLNGQKLTNNVDYQELTSSSIQIEQDLVIGDKLTFRVGLLRTSITSSTGGGSGSGMPDPMTQAGDLIYRNSSNVTSRLPIGTQGYVLSVTDANTVAWSAPSSSSQDISLINGNAGTLSALTPIHSNINGEADIIDVSIESQALAIVGLTKVSINSGATGTIVTSGKLFNIGGIWSFGDVLFVSKTGELTNVKPDIGVGGFVSGDFVIKLGVITKNLANPTQKDLILNVQIMGQL